MIRKSYLFACDSRFRLEIIFEGSYFETRSERGAYGTGSASIQGGVRYGPINRDSQRSWAELYEISPDFFHFRRSWSPQSRGR